MNLQKKSMWKIIDDMKTKSIENNLDNLPQELIDDINIYKKSVITNTNPNGCVNCGNPIDVWFFKKINSDKNINGTDFYKLYSDSHEKNYSTNDYYSAIGFSSMKNIFWEGLCSKCQITYIACIKCSTDSKYANKKTALNKVHPSKLKKIQLCKFIGFWGYEFNDCGDKKIEKYNLPLKKVDSGKYEYDNQIYSAINIYFLKPHKKYIEDEFFIDIDNNDNNSDECDDCDNSLMDEAVIKEETDQFYIVAHIENHDDKCLSIIKKLTPYQESMYEKDCFVNGKELFSVKHYYGYKNQFWAKYSGSLTGPDGGFFHYWNVLDVTKLII